MYGCDALNARTGMKMTSLPKLQNNRATSALMHFKGKRALPTLAVRGWRVFCLEPWG